MNLVTMPLNIVGAGLGVGLAAKNAGEGETTKAAGWGLVAAGNIACVGSNFVRGGGGAALAMGGLLAAAAGVGLTFVG
jgi:hypothetical protein